MQNLYLLDKQDIKRIREMVDLLEKAVQEIIELKQITTVKTDPYAAAQSDLIEEESFIEQQLDFFNHPLEHNLTME